MDKELQKKNCTEIIDESGNKKYIVRKIDVPKKKPFYSFIKRSFDIFVSLISSIVFLPFMLLIALAIKIDSKGPIFYKQERVGLNGKKFMLYKFRSMVQNAEKDGAQWATLNDERCTKVGRFLRKSRLDELPQIPCNILVGNLTFIGPRPERQCFYDQFADYIDGFEQRLLVKPGLSGLAQVNGGYNHKPHEKIVYDIEYIEKRSLWMDFVIVLRTVLVVFNHKGAR